MAAEGASEAVSKADAELVQGALLSVRRLGDFPSKSALAEAEQQLTAVLQRWQVLRAVPPSEVSSVLRQRAAVRLLSGQESAAMEDLDGALQICREFQKLPAIEFEEMPRVLVSRASAYARQSQWTSALQDLDAAAELLGDPLEDFELLRSRARTKMRLGMFTGAAEDSAAAAELLRGVGRRPEAEIEAELQAVALLSAGALPESEAELCGVIRRCVGLMSKDVSLLQRVVIADSDARMLMAAIAWSNGQVEIAETYWRDGCDRVDILADEAGTKQLAIGYPNGEVYGCSIYTNSTWLKDVRYWPSSAVEWLQDFLRNRPAEPPRQSYVQDLMVGRRPGDGSTLMDLAIATDVFRRSNPVEDLQANIERSGKLNSRQFK